MERERILMEGLPVYRLDQSEGLLVLVSYRYNNRYFRVARTRTSVPSQPIVRRVGKVVNPLKNKINQYAAQSGALTFGQKKLLRSKVQKNRNNKQTKKFNSFNSPNIL